MDKTEVYFTKNITPEGLINVYKSLGVNLDGKVGVKISIGERGSKGYLKPELIGPLVQSLHGTIVECNTNSRGARTKTEEHIKVAQEHGYTKIAAVDILDSQGEIKIPVNNGKWLKSCIIGKNFDEYDSFLVLSHAKGDATCGFGAALKNNALGFSSKTGKVYINSAGQTTSPMMLMFKKPDQKALIESVAEAAKAVSDYAKEHEKDIIYITVMNYISLDCDCDKNQGAPVMKDVGIFGSTDPVALDEAILDTIWRSEEHGAAALRDLIEKQKGRHITQYAEKIVFGTTDYDLIDLDTGERKHKGEENQPDETDSEPVQFGEGLIQRAEDVKGLQNQY
jgi:uncharacterized Fe-S center protein